MSNHQKRNTFKRVKKHPHTTPLTPPLARVPKDGEGLALETSPSARGSAVPKEKGVERGAAIPNKFLSLKILFFDVQLKNIKKTPGKKTCGV